MSIGQLKKNIVQTGKMFREQQRIHVARLAYKCKICEQALKDAVEKRQKQLDDARLQYKKLQQKKVKHQTEDIGEEAQGKL